ncbi:hypothetical protein KC19_3G163100 [Ceratodon purpureus]|uniref:Uncharacterized protein n=1 Tax=Ceratodon purpureus TaxID=3225 RepID=A0A8T0IMK4_CERPU|nr:hypothetical protein KC19_3G163100 [Ceratodon purpureus]
MIVKPLLSHSSELSLGYTQLCPFGEGCIHLIRLSCKHPKILFRNSRGKHVMNFANLLTRMNGT